jgi:hypothetical protein
MSYIVPSSVPRGRGTEEDKAKWHKFLSTTALIERNASSARDTSHSTRERHTREKTPLSASPCVNSDLPQDARLHPFNNPGEVNPQFLLTDDIHEAMDALIKHGVEEIEPEPLLLGHFKFLCEEGKFNTIEDVKDAYARVLGDDKLRLSKEFIYQITLNLFRSSDPFGQISRDFASKQMDMLEGERKLYRENMKQLQKTVEEDIC